MPRRCLFGCERNEASLHRLPNPKKFPDQFKTWVRLAGGKLETHEDYEFYKKKRVCDIHFTARDRNRNNRLIASAVPSLHLPDQLDSLSQTLEIVQQQLLDQPSMSTHSVEGPAPSRATYRGQLDSLTQTLEIDQQQLLDQASTSTHSIAPSRATYRGQLDSLTQTLEIDQQQLLDQPSTSTHSIAPSRATYRDAVYNDGIAVSQIVMEHNYSVISKNKQNKDKKMVYKCAQLKSFGSKIKYLQNEILRLRKKGQSFKTRLINAEKVTENLAFKRVLQNMSAPAQLFLHMQLQTAKKPKGRRFTNKEKILSLSLYKKSPKTYALLHKFFTLPSAKAMKRLLGKIKLNPGINPIIFEKIKSNILGMDIADRLCCLIFDEMSIKPQVFYNEQKDVFEGFSNINENMFADHALVFMIKGLKRSYKQPIAYYFTNALKKVELLTIMKSVIKFAQDSGLIIVNTVCDQSTVNVSAITELVNETKNIYRRLNKEWHHDVFRLNGKDIIPIFDAPHLIKGIRNNLLNKDMTYTINNEEKIVKWEFYQLVYAADKSYGELRLLNKLTEEHINPEKIKKMRVKSATQIFSHSVAVATEHLAARGDVPIECRQLIDITLLIDNLFDTLNVNTFHVPNGKKFKGPIKRQSPHHQLWKEAKLVLKTIKFRQKKRIGHQIRLVETMVPSVKNLIKTIEGMEAIWKVLSGKYLIDTMLSRNFNQDPIENFFGNIRSYGARNVCPNTISFESSFKALLLNNYNSPHSNSANCEKDSNKCLQTFEFFLTEISDDSSNDPIDNINNNKMLTVNISREMDAGQRNYVCGWVLKKCLKAVIKGCVICRQNLINTENKNNTFIHAKEYNKNKWLCYPTEELENCFHDLQNVITAFLENDVPKRNVKKNIITFADVIVNYPFKCERHKEKLTNFFKNITINIILYSWTRSINRILDGKITYDGENKTKIAAQNYYKKHKKYKNKK